MLTRWSMATAALTLAALTLCTPAYADGSPPPGTGGAECDMFICQVEADAPGTAGGGKTTQSGEEKGNSGEGGGKTSLRTCTYKLADPQPRVGSPDWEGHTPGDGAVYEQRCKLAGDATLTVIRMVWAADPPQGGGVDPAVLAQRAVDDMRLRGPQIGITPKPGGKGVVGMPVYLWTATGPETYGPNSASASAGAVTVTATARVSKIDWQMGDGNTVTCTTAGTPYQPEYGKQPSPDCGYRYNQPSSTTPSGKFHVAATSTWLIDWTATTGQAGQLTEVRDSAVDITVAEVQVLN
ncbi:ATP/GTP-binding protein [Streptomyces sp. CBMA152]|uniref:ATP/GTP-binding protein n=1 Tax=Streptomyces sp. CBMA152 TaxID=1896312 RepID=UPI0016604773|nr:ATP/GTP-binding protein [Streptomyces sp. CBMA152]MBD0742963.1 ATP/GTP-binding protein [Streptomyces sp. CBMA152]